MTLEKLITTLEYIGRQPGLQCYQEGKLVDVADVCSSASFELTTMIACMKACDLKLKDSVNLTDSQCKNIAEFIDLYLIDAIRKDPEIDNINYIKDMIAAMEILQKRADKKEAFSAKHDVYPF